MKSLFLGGLVLGLLLGYGFAIAGSQSLGPGERWLTVASTKDIDTAKGIATYYGWKQAKVMSSQSGWYAVVMGPYAATTREQLAKLEPNLTDLPVDAILSDGHNYIDTAWEPKANGEGSLTNYGPGQDAQFSFGSVTFKVRMTGDEDNPGPTRIQGYDNGNQIFAFETGADFTVLESETGLVKLDPRTEIPQLVVTRFTGGAHCCTKTWIVTKTSGNPGWTMLEADMLDGSGYAYEDLDHDGVSEMISRDNRFLYAFDSYAGSSAPTRIAQLHGGKIKDTTSDPKWVRQWRQELGYMEFSAKLDPGMWTTNGFLVAWLAQKILLGEGDAAWAKTMETYDKDSDFGPRECIVKLAIDSCPYEQQRKIPFPRAVATFLRDVEYQPLPDAARKLIQ